MGQCEVHYGFSLLPKVLKAGPTYPQASGAPKEIVWWGGKG
jgi:hypothetical protein